MDISSSQCAIPKRCFCFQALTHQKDSRVKTGILRALVAFIRSYGKCVKSRLAILKTALNPYGRIMLQDIYPYPQSVCKMQLVTHSPIFFNVIKKNCHLHGLHLTLYHVFVISILAVVPEVSKMCVFVCRREEIVFVRIHLVNSTSLSRTKSINKGCEKV